MSFYQSVIGIISKPSEKRHDDEINFILNWFINLFKKKPAVFGDVKAEVIKDIIKNCSFETKNTDEIIINQGDIGDCFYVNLRGKVSVYINHNKYDELDNLDDLTQQNQSLSKSDAINNKENNAFYEDLTLTSEEKSKRLREKLGNYVISLGAGEGFGEYALISDDTRSASIIADEKTDLMVVNKQLYARCLKAQTLQKLEEKKVFINNSPFFGNWSPKMKKLLSLSLERDIVPYDSYLGKQGDTLDRIYFIISGQAKITVNPTMHKVQYPRLHPLKLAENEEQDLINTWIEEKKHILKNIPKSQMKSANVNSLINKNTSIKRRNETFAEAEHRLKIKNIEVGIIGPGEITGMCEMIFDMSSYMQSTKCMENCEVFYLYKRSYERLVAKRNPQCIKKMSGNVYMKLKARNTRLKSSIPVDLFRSIQYRIELEIKNTSDTNNLNQNNNRSNNYSSMMNQYESKPDHHNNEEETQNENKTSIFKSIPRGPIIQMDLREKTVAYLKLKNLTSRREKQMKIERKSMIDKIVLAKFGKINLNDSGNMESSSSETNSLNDAKPGDSARNFNNQNQQFELIDDDPNNLALDDLEQRIKQWHLELGCKKAPVAKLNRIDLTKLKSDIKTGENVFIKKPSLKHHFHASNVNTSNANSSSNESNCLSDNEADYYPRPVTDFDRLKSTRESSNRMSQQLTQSEYNLLIPPLHFNNNTNNNTNNINNNEMMNNDETSKDNSFIGGLLKLVYINEAAIESSKATFDNQNSRKLNSNQEMSSSSFQQANLNESVTIEKPKIVSSLIACNDQQLASASLQAANLSSSDKKTENMADANKNADIQLNKFSRKTSLPNLAFINKNNSRQSTQQLPSYLISRKFSFGQIKIQLTGKAYTKEEYSALKDHLKKQTKKFNVHTINSSC